MAATTQSTVQSAPSTSVSVDQSSFLRRVLRINAIVSILSGLFFIVDSQPIAEFMGINAQTYLGFLNGSTFILAVGVMTLLFAAGVWWVASQPPLNATFGREILALDIAWVVISAVLLLTNALSLSTAGSWAVLIAADAVATLAALEYYGLRRMSR
ncbi:MAG TPA: hypothetical protein VHL11_13870 [Phototrophicaceae bacterium]|jgi:hypothetical protein|nr:hypothetical protein [Phototrophicaceae bacterium]